ncbi:MAG: hypothetical protein L0Y54_15090 [Sporichthyaceae bacterium]|nr:hypothetical protein [Sporichthyaceae bacterium]
MRGVHDRPLEVNPHNGGPSARRWRLLEQAIDANPGHPLQDSAGRRVRHRLDLASQQPREVPTPQRGLLAQLTAMLVEQGDQIVMTEVA